MSEKTVLILERSSQNLKKVSKDGRTMLEGVFAEFGVENRNGRVYEEGEYLPHMEYLQKDIKSGNLLGELDHPERFEVSLGNVSHKISELWYDQGKRQVLGRIEILEGTPKGQIAKSLLDAGVPLSISSRAAGSVNEDKSVNIQQIYTFDLVAKPGFENATLQQVNEGIADPETVRIAALLESFNKSSKKQKEDDISAEVGILCENISIIDVTEKFPAVVLREEAKSLIQKNKEIMEKKNAKPGDEALNEWTQQFNDSLVALDKRLAGVESAILESGGMVEGNGELKTIKGYIEKIRSIQESAINWQTDIAKNLNKIGNHSKKLAEKSEKHYDLTQKLVETVDYNAKTLNATQDWVGNNAEVTNVVAETVDHNAKMLNHVNEWVEKLNEWGEEKATAINDMHEWVSEQAKAVNGMHEWTTSIAKNLNHTSSYAQDMFGRSLSKEDGSKLVEYIELVAESKKNPKLKKKVNEMLTTHSITEKDLSEGEFANTITTNSTLKVKEVLDKTKTVGNTKVGDMKAKDKASQFAPLGKADDRGLNKKGVAPSNAQPGVLSPKVPIQDKNVAKVTVGKDGKKVLSIRVPKQGGSDSQTTGKGQENLSGKDGPKGKTGMKLNQKAEGNQSDVLSEENEEKEIDRTLSIKTRSSKLDERLEKIVKSLEKERELDEGTKSQYPFTQLLSESDRKEFAALSESDKTKVHAKIQKVPTTEPGQIKKLWEAAIAAEQVEEPRWLELAPKAYKSLYEAADEQVKTMINARAEYVELVNEYQIENFWQLSGLTAPSVAPLNENVVAPKKNDETDLDPMVKAVKDKMMSYDR
jgi:hypothetical protein